MVRCLWGVVFAVLATACARREAETGLSGTIEFADVRVGSLVGGRVIEVLAREGALAAKDEVLVRLDPSEWQSHLDEAQALAVSTRRELDLLLAGARPEEIARADAEGRRLELLWQVMKLGARPEEIAAAREDFRAAEALVTEASQALGRERQLQSGSATTVEAMDKAVALHATVQARAAASGQRLSLLERGFRPEETEASHQAYLAARAGADLLRAGARPEEIAARRATLEAAEARIRTAESRLRELTIRSPADVMVQTLDLRPGDLIAQGTPIATLLLRERPWMTVYVPDARLASVTVGQAAVIQPDGHPPVAGRVTWISRRSEYTPRNVQTREERVTQVFAVKVEIEGDASNLKDGLWADLLLK